MANGYTYEIRLRDLMTQQLNRAKQAAGSFSQKMVDAANKSRKATDGTRTSVYRLQAQLTELQNAKYTEFDTKKIGQFNKQIKQTKKELERLDGLPRPGILGRFRQMGAKIGSLIGLTGGLTIAMAGIGAIGGIVKMGADLEQTRISFQTMMGSVEKGNKMIKDITSLGAATPFGNKELQDNAKLLLNFGTAGDKVIPTLKTLGDVSGGNVERLNGLTLAYAQVSSAGKLQGQDLMQMINAGFNPLDEISRVTGRSLGELREQMSKGGISAKMVELAFQSATGEGGKFNGMMEKQSQTLGGKWSTFLDTVMDKMAIFGEALAPYLATIVDYATQVLEVLFAIPGALIDMYDWMKKNKVVLGLAAIAVAALTSGMWLGFAATLGWSILLGAMNLIISIATGAIWLWETAQWAINAALTANPIGLIIAAIALLIAAVYYMVQHWDYFKEKFVAIWDIVKAVVGIAVLAVKSDFQRIGIFIQILWAKFKGFGQWIKGFFGNIGKSLKLAFSGDFSGAKKALTAPIKTTTDAEISRLQKEQKKITSNQVKETTKMVRDAAKAYDVLTKKPPTKAGKKLAALSKKGNGKKTAEEIEAEMEAELGAGGSGADGGKSGKGSAKEKADQVVTGGKKSLVYNINIENVVKDIRQNITNGKESADELVDEILDQLTRRLSGTFKSATE